MDAGRLQGCRTTAGRQELEQRRSGCRARAPPGAVAEVDRVGNSDRERRSTRSTSARYLSHRVGVLVDFLVERFGDNPNWDTFLAQQGQA